jgi:hypothetical protein
LTSIRFGGTMAQWNAFNSSIRGITIYCSDGEISVN